ncbi:MAG: class II aldolase/adducin family protein [Deltaproteobacteria bacterium]|nr:MAG: class II aldolase/adducin family protein [Deltaproteobacteria bacterium]
MDAHYDALVRFAHAAAESGLLASTCGNASVRVGPDRMLVTASGSSLATLTRADIALVSLADGAPEGGPRPSMEVGFHRRAYRERPQANAVLHCQSRAATILACAVDPPANLDFVPEVPAYVRRHAYADWAPPGTEALADAVGRALAADPAVTVVQLRNHGQVIVGGSWQAVIRRGVFFEMACGIATSGVAVRPIPDADAQALRDLCGDV